MSAHEVRDHGGDLRELHSEACCLDLERMKRCVHSTGLVLSREHALLRASLQLHSEKTAAGRH